MLKILVYYAGFSKQALPASFGAVCIFQWAIISLACFFLNLELHLNFNSLNKITVFVATAGDGHHAIEYVSN